jgi:uroporphyrinogen-III synthase
LHPDVIPAAFDSDHLAQALLPATHGQAVLLARADRGRDLLRQVLSQVARVTEVAVYSQVENLDIDPEILRELRLGRIDWVTLTSSNLARSFARVVDDQIRPWLGERTRLVCISPLTAAAAQAAGLPVAGAATVFTAEGLVQTLLELAEPSPEPVNQAD